MEFDEYFFADYSGAESAIAQRRAIRLAEAGPADCPSIVERRFTRDELVEEFLRRLRIATDGGRRVCFGQDHQFSLPIALFEELDLAALDWRDALDLVITGDFHPEAPAFDTPAIYARQFNDWLVAQGHTPYFYSATKGERYGIPTRNPRPSIDELHRITERRSGSGRAVPKCFNRLGDPGTVGGQTLLGLRSIHQLLRRCRQEGVPLAIWPFDGLSLGDPAYEGAHVMIEPYPSAVRASDVPQSDAADALASVETVWKADREGRLRSLLDLSSLNPEQARIVRLEGWIAFHEPAGNWAD